MSVAIVIPYYKKQLHPDEELSLRHLLQYLTDYDKYIIAPVSLPISTNLFQIKRFDDSYFLSVRDYNRLMLSLEFYDAFIRYEYILIYQLDCLVFSNELSYWCDKEYDYVGAPWVDYSIQHGLKLLGVGNGGFSLRRTSTFISVLNSKIKLNSDDLQSLRNFGRKEDTISDLLFKLKLAPLMGHFRSARWCSKKYKNNEDIFWSNIAEKFHPSFKVAPIECAIRFAFEKEPRACYERIGYNLPFGCHAWAKYDKSFWEPYLLK